MKTPFWLAEQAPQLEQRRMDSVDVEIIGAGITGCSTALALARGGLRVRVRDRRGVAEGASGRNGGFALRGGAARYDVARDTYGADAARELWLRTENELTELERVAEDAFRRTGSLRRLSRRARVARGGDRRALAARLRIRARRRAGAVALPGAQPRDRGAVRCNRRCRGARAKRCADHGGLRTGGRS